MNRNILSLAYLGDSVFELKIREYFVFKADYKVNDLQTMSSKYASAKAHKKIVDFLLESNILNDEELTIYKRGRNTKVNTKRKNFNSINYHASTGFEALIGYLYINNNITRIDEIINIILDKFELKEER